MDKQGKLFLGIIFTFGAFLLRCLVRVFGKHLVNNSVEYLADIVIL